MNVMESARFIMSLIEGYLLLHGHFLSYKRILIMNAMFGFFTKDTTDYKKLLKEGAVLIDVRTKEEFTRGSVKGAKNMPLSTLASSATQLHKEKPIILCCASGARSSAGKALLESLGFKEVYNGGNVMSLQKKLH